MRKHLYSWAALYVLIGVMSFVLFLFEKGIPYSFQQSDIVPIFMAVLHVAAGFVFFIQAQPKNQVEHAWKMADDLSKQTGHGRHRPYPDDQMFLPEGIFALTLIIFLFNYIFALAANMDYVQRFIETGGQLDLALDSRSQRVRVMFRYGLYLLAYPAAVWMRLLTSVKGQRRKNLQSFFRLLLVIASAVVYSFSFPSFLHHDGLGFLAWGALIPLFIILRRSYFPRFMFYGVFWMILTVLLKNYWLGTFSLVSLQVATLILGLYGILFFLVLWGIELILRYFEKIFPERYILHVLMFALLYSAAWTVFDWVQTQGFTAYPWTLMPHSQWKNLLLIQYSAVTGMWGISQILYLANAVIASLYVFPGAYKPARRLIFSLAAVYIAVIHLLGAIALLQAGPKQAEEVARVILDGNENMVQVIPDERTPGDPAEVEEGSVRIALVQQNSDPRKHDYEEVFRTLTRLTDGILNAVPEVDLVAWSETAFVPNISRWGAEDQDPDRRLVRLVRQMLEYQRSMETWLLTGNDDYTVVLDDDGRELERLNYNAAVLFDNEGRRRETYHKMKLVPFTEHFPYERQFPRLYQFLLDYDVNFWEPGTEPTVFEHPKLSFSTPICFEDAFPLEVRSFVREGAGMILNISNDYWSLTEVAAKQHFAAALFRATEHRKYLLRSTSSGVTTAVDPMGRIIFELPGYTAAASAVDIPVETPGGPTFYTLAGDWYIWLIFLGIAVLLASILISMGVSIFRFGNDY
ncbi:apolipoprotein N-acyltransferase [Salinispira pacifica]|uniref:apolipoprotein N-acyltransferase n=1 Tax=Salinispira pacifica TaxID=1307761 RepID=UPI0006A72D76|nr:apolipoprotein N-acyltransferase [Salinispira pacifica]